jgi:hypothetical protein
MTHAICLFCGSSWCTCFDTDEEYIVKYKSSSMKIDELVDMLDRAFLETTELVGGYPPIVCKIPGWLIVSGIVDDEPDLSVYDEKTCLKWMRDIKKHLKQFPDEDERDAIYETMPKSC